MTVWAGQYDIVGNAPPAWLTDDMKWEWSVDNGVKWFPKNCTIESYSEAKAWESIDCIRVEVQPSPADTVTITRMTEAEARHLARGENASWVMGSLAMLRHFDLIRPATKAETIATKTNLPLADVERVIAAFGEEGL